MEIFVGNLPFEVTQEELNAAFAQYGEVASIKMLTDRETGRFRGIAFVTMNDAEQGANAIKSLNGADMGGRAMRVDESKPRESRPGGFGGGRGNFGGGNRGGGFGGGRGGFGGGNRGGFGGGRGRSFGDR